MKTKEQLIAFIGRMDAQMQYIPEGLDSNRREQRIYRILHAENKAMDLLSDADFSAYLVLERFKRERSFCGQRLLSNFIDKGINKLDNFIADIDRRVADIHG